MMKQFAKKLVAKYRYPYIFTHGRLVPNQPIHFHINNAVEQFRLQKLGGESGQLEALLGLLHEDDVMYDIGASVGAWSIPSAKKLKNGKVISFEPDPENQLHLQKNFELNNLANYTIIPAGIGEKEGEMELFTAGANAFSPSLKPVNKIASSIKVKIETIDGLLADGKIPVPDIIKIDIEGAEMMALRGMAALLSGPQKPRALVLELHPLYLPSFETDLTEIFQFLIEKKYRIGELASREDQVICTWYA